MSIEFHIAERFDGPLDWLLSEIQKRNINIYDIPIAEITDQFLEYIHSVEGVGLRDLSDFYKMAADLIYIKSQMMLPGDVDFGEDDYEDPREDLVERLLEYSKFRRYSDMLIGKEVSGDFNIKRRENEFSIPFSNEELFAGVDTKSLFEAFVEALKKTEVDKKVYNVYEEVSENEKLALMNELLEVNETVKFSDLFVINSAANIICSFLAVLEAVKDKIVIIEQPSSFGEIFIRKRPDDWNVSLADENDDMYDELSENNLEDPDNFCIIEKDYDNGRCDESD